MKKLTKSTALLTSVLFLAALATPASAADPVPLKRTAITAPLNAAPVVTAEANSPINFERVGVTSIRAKAVEIVPLATAAPVQNNQQTITQTSGPSAAPSNIPVTPGPVAVQSAPQRSSIPSNSGLAGAALAQLGVPQDCTAMVENALRANGIAVGDLAPAQFAQFGTPVGNIQAGDILIYPGHVAIAISPTEAVHGGLNGMNTGIAGVNVPSAPYQIIRVG